MVEKDIYLISKNIVVNVVLLRGLWRQNEGLDKPSHGLAIVGQLPGDLDHDTLSQGLVGVHLDKDKNKFTNEKKGKE